MPQNSHACRRIAAIENIIEKHLAYYAQKMYNYKPSGAWDKRFV